MRYARFLNFLGNVCYFFDKANDLFSEKWVGLSYLWRMIIILFSYKFVLIFGSAEMVFTSLVISIIFLNRVVHHYDVWTTGANKFWNLSATKKEEAFQI